jgi:hypothetical protein
MRTTCSKCFKRYDDADYHTICPHTPVGSSIEPFHPTDNPGGYCREHDLFGCTLHKEAPAEQGN